MTYDQKLLLAIQCTLPQSRSWSPMFRAHDGNFIPLFLFGFSILILMNEKVESVHHIQDQILRNSTWTCL